MGSRVLNVNDPVSMFSVRSSAISYRGGELLQRRFFDLENLNIMSSPEGWIPLCKLVTLYS